MSLEQALKNLKREIEPMRRDPKAHVSYRAQGQLDIIHRMLPEVRKIEGAMVMAQERCIKLRREIDQAERNSGFGRGDSMG